MRQTLFFHHATTSHGPAAPTAVALPSSVAIGRGSAADEAREADEPSATAGVSAANAVARTPLRLDARSYASTSGGDQTYGVVVVTATNPSRSRIGRLSSEASTSM